jgi:cell division protein ZapD
MHKNKVDVMENSTTTFEQPLNETIRLCLRLEHLFIQFHAHSPSEDISASHLAMLALLRILGVIDRPDLKSKITQALSQHATTLSQLEQFPQVDQVQLRKVLNQLDASLKHFHGNHKKIGEALRSNSFLNQIYSHLNNPAGLCNFTTPAYTVWKQKPSQTRIADLKGWFKVFDELERAVNVILRLTRQSTPAKTIPIEDGFYHQPLDATLPAQLVRISIDNPNIYPEMSVGKHHLSVRFMQIDPNNNGHAIQYKKPFECTLACCRI